MMNKKAHAKRRRAAKAYINQRKWMRALRRWQRAGHPL